jgi:hypothetical protein
MPVQPLGRAWSLSERSVTGLGRRAVSVGTCCAASVLRRSGPARMFRAFRLGEHVAGRGATWSARSGQGERSLYRARLRARHGDGAVGSGVVGW